MTLVLGNASASDSPCATTWLVPKTLVSTGVATTAAPTPNNPPMLPDAAPRTPSHRGEWFICAEGGEWVVNIRTRL
ncbi:hypothetical protein D3C73_1497570 [compost metagenome]